MEKSVSRHTRNESVALESLLNSRYSCRAFREEQVPTETVNRIFALAQRTPSWCNTQPWEVTLVEGENLVALIDPLMKQLAARTERWDFPPPAAYEGVYGRRRRASGFALYESLGIARDDHNARMIQGVKNFEFFGAPHVAIISTDVALGTYGAVDAGAYLMTLMLAAESMGIASVAQAGIAMQAGFLREHLGIGDDRRVVAAVSFGFPDEEHPVNAFRTDREPDLTSVVRRWTQR